MRWRDPRGVRPSSTGSTERSVPVCLRVTSWITNPVDALRLPKAALDEGQGGATRPSTAHPPSWRSSLSRTRSTVANSCSVSPVTPYILLQEPLPIHSKTLPADKRAEAR